MDRAPRIGVAPMPGATLSSASPCTTPGFDAKCGTGYCGHVGANNFCVYPCNNGGDCGGGSCTTANATVEGVADNGKICN